MTQQQNTFDQDSANLRGLEAQRYRAMTERDLGALDRLFDIRLIYTHSSGVRESKQEYMKSVTDRVYVYGPITHSEDTIHIAGNTAVVFGEMHADIEVRGVPKRLDNVATSTWIRNRGGEWRLVAYQTTRRETV